MSDTQSGQMAEIAPSDNVADGVPEGGPAKTADRIGSLDFIRGLAVMGILWANIVAFGHPSLAYFFPDALPQGGTASDEWVWLFQYTFVDGKFRGLFTLLFGAGLYLFMQRVWERGGGVSIQARRLFWLALFGLTHFFFIWFGDILFTYALAGFLALLFIGTKARTQFIWACIIYAIGALFFTGGLYFQAFVVANPGFDAEMVALAQAEYENALVSADAARAAYQGSYGEIVAYNFTANATKLAFYPFIAVLESLPLMLLGMAFFRWGLFEQSWDRVKAVRWAWIAVAVSALWSAYLGWGVMQDGFPFTGTSYVFNGAGHVARLPMVIGLVVLLAYWAPTAAQSSLGERVIAAGRVAFTNYIGTSVLMMFVFQGWALGLFGQLSRIELLVPMLAAWIIMLAWSKPWLDRFRYGPLEWLWRCLTYGKLFPMRR